MKIKIVSQDIWIDISFLVGLVWGVECKVSREEAELLVLAIEEALENEFDWNSEDYPSEFDDDGRRRLTMPPHAFITRVEGVATDTLHNRVRHFAADLCCREAQVALEDCPRRYCGGQGEWRGSAAVRGDDRGAVCRLGMNNAMIAFTFYGVT